MPGFDITRGSCLECAAVLDVLVAKAIVKESDVSPGKEMLLQIVSMLFGLIKSNSEHRVYEPLAESCREVCQNCPLLKRCST